MNDVAIAGSIILLLVACLLIMRTIKRLQTPFPNELLIRIHLANFIIYELLTAPGFPLFGVAQEDKDELEASRLSFYLAILNNIQYPFGVYLDCFLLYLIYKFTSEPNKKTHDKVLDKQVPVVVFIKNQKILHDVFA